MSISIAPPACLNRESAQLHQQAQCEHVLQPSTGKDPGEMCPGIVHDDKDISPNIWDRHCQSMACTCSLAHTPNSSSALCTVWMCKLSKLSDRQEFNGVLFPEALERICQNYIRNVNNKCQSRLTASFTSVVWYWSKRTHQERKSDFSWLTVSMDDW